MNRSTPEIKIRLFFRLVLIVALLAPLWVSSKSQAADSETQVLPFQTIPLPPDASFYTLDVGLLEKLPSKYAKLDSSLAELLLAENEAARQQTAQAHALRLVDDQIQVQIVIDPHKPDSLRQSITQAGGRLTKTSLDGSVVQAWLPVSALEGLSNHPDVYQVRQPAPMIYEEIDEGTFTTEALPALNGVVWHSAGYTGVGVKIGIIDGGFSGYLGLLGTDLPAVITARTFVDGESDANLNTGSKHGTACAEVIYDIAPGADFYLAKINTNLDLVEAVAWLRDTIQVDIISTSFGFYNLTPGDGTGEFENLIRSARDAGILWVTAAGNDQQVHWGGPFIDKDGDTTHDYYDNGNVNYFGLQTSQAYVIPAGYNIQVYMRWDDWFYVTQDYDLYLVVQTTTGWATVASSTRDQTGLPGQSPAEFISILAPYQGIYGFVVVRHKATRLVNLEIHAPNMSGLHYRVTSRSLVNMADAPSAMTVAALNAISPYVLEPYSSFGPTNGPGGTYSGGFIKPDISGYANVSTVSYGSGSYKFNGTSAATPHVAGAAALALSAYPSFNPDSLQTFLESRAVDMGTVGMDTQYGYGRLYLGAPTVIKQVQTELFLPIILGN